VSLYNQDKTNEIKDIAKSEKFTLFITKDNDKIFSTNEGTHINKDINNEANPSKLIYDKVGDNHRYTFKTSLKDKDIIISSIDNEIFELQVGIWKYVGLIGLFVLIIIFFRSEEHTSELQSRFDLVCRLLLEKKKIRCN